MRSYFYLIFFTKFNIFNISDVNECSTANGGCHSNASCINSIGSYMCVCNQGFDGNGTNCTGKCFHLLIFVMPCMSKFSKPFNANFVSIPLIVLV